MHPKVNESKYSLLAFQCLSLYIILVQLYGIEGTVLTQNKDVELGGNVTLRCILTRPADTILVTWQKKTEAGAENMAVFNETTVGNIFLPYKHRIRFTNVGLNDTAIIFPNVSLQDNGCYRCIFNTFPLGNKAGTPCLSVYDHLKTSVHYKISEGHLNASCFATGLPRPNISWVASGGEKSEREITNPNGTVSVISSILVNVSSLKQTLICRVSHRGEETDLKVPVKEKGYPDPVVLTVLVLIIVIVVIIAVCCWRRHRKKRSATAGKRFDSERNLVNSKVQNTFFPEVGCSCGTKGVLRYSSTNHWIPEQRRKSLSNAYKDEQFDVVTGFKANSHPSVTSGGKWDNSRETIELKQFVSGVISLWKLSH